MRMRRRLILIYVLDHGSKLRLPGSSGICHDFGFCGWLSSAGRVVQTLDLHRVLSKVTHLDRAKHR
jgi:hypothetical protein